jgi:hypothetical protein
MISKKSYKFCRDKKRDFSVYNQFTSYFDEYYYKLTGIHYDPTKLLFEDIAKSGKVGIFISFNYFAVDPNNDHATIAVDYPYVNACIYERSATDIIKMMYDDATNKGLIFICPLSKIISQTTFDIFINIFDKMKLKYKI